MLFLISGYGLSVITLVTVEIYSETKAVYTQASEQKARRTAMALGKNAPS